MEAVSSRCAKILLYLKISIRWGSVLLRHAPLIRRRKCKVHEPGFVTVAASLLHLHYNSENTNTHMHTKEPPPHHHHHFPLNHLQLPEPFRVTTTVCLMLLQCSVRSVAIEFVPLKRI